MSFRNSRYVIALGFILVFGLMIALTGTSLSYISAIYHQAETVVNNFLLEIETSARFDEISSTAADGAAKAVTDAAREYHNAYALILLLGIGGICLGTIIALFVIRRTSLTEDALFREKEQAEVTLHAIGDAVITTDAQGMIVYFNPVAEQLTGWSLEEARGKPLKTIYHVINEITREPTEHPIDPGYSEGHVAEIGKFTTLINRNKEEFAIEGSSAGIRNSAGKIIGIVLVFRDVTEPRSLAQQLIQQASHDALTGLANRRKFEILLQQLLESAKTQNKQHAMLYLDLDQFKLVNDTCGHIAGDELLRQLADVLQSKVRNSDTLARLGGDEFGVLLDGCPEDQAERIANELREVVQDFRFMWQGKTFRIGVSIGLVNITQDSKDSLSILTAADTSCYIAKEKGRNRIWIHQPHDGEVLQRHGEMQWILRITEAFEQNRFRLYKQTAMPLNNNGKQTKYEELLLRMIDSNSALIMPMAFIPAAERYGVMPSIDRWIIRKAFSWLIAGPIKKDEPYVLAINLSGQSLCDDYFLDFIIEQLAVSQINPRQICFEITETAAIVNWGRALRFISTLKDMGCSFALDDFGSGMSSFAYLKSLPVDFIKIDGSFVKDMVNDQVDFTMVELINRLGHLMNIKTIAESVEDQAVLEKITQLGVDYAQGHSVHIPELLELNVPEIR